MFDPIKFFQPDYLFDLRPFTTAGTIKTMMIFFGLLTLAGIILKIYDGVAKAEKFQHKLQEKIVSFLTTLGLLGIGLTWVRYERVQVLSGRFWLVVWLIVAVWWLYSIAKYRLKVLPTAKKQSEEKKSMQKYLPKGK